MKHNANTYECEDLTTFAENFIRSKMLNEEQERYDGGNEFNHLEQAVYAATELHDALQSLRTENPSKFNRYGQTLKKVSALTKELPSMLEALKSGDDDERDEYDPQDWLDDDWSDDREEENKKRHEEEDYEDDDGEDDLDESFTPPPSECPACKCKDRNLLRYDPKSGNFKCLKCHYFKNIGTKGLWDSTQIRRNGRSRVDEEFCVRIERPASDLESQTWQCEDFWKTVHENNLEDALDDFFEQAYPDGLTLTEFNDILRFDGDSVLEAIGYSGGEYEEDA